LFSRSLLINPNSAMALTLAGWIETMCGNQGAGREMVARAQRLNPRDPRGWLMSGVMALAAVIDENYAEAEWWAERALAQNRRFAVALRVLAVALVKLGRQNRARQAVRELLEIEPELTISGFFARIPVPVESMAKTYADALKTAGLPRRASRPMPRAAPRGPCPYSWWCQKPLAPSGIKVGIRVRIFVEDRCKLRCSLPPKS